MSLNLKPVLNTQTDNEKLDVVNYNFDQIVNIVKFTNGKNKKILF